jgi:hypothetical protein
VKHTLCVNYPGDVYSQNTDNNAKDSRKTGSENIETATTTTATQAADTDNSTKDGRETRSSNTKTTTTHTKDTLTVQLSIVSASL